MFRIRKEQKDAFDDAFERRWTPCTLCAVVRFVEIRGLYRPGDRRVNPPAHTTSGSSYVYGYASEDDQGRIFISRDVTGTWKRSTQGIEITVRVDPPSLKIPPGTMIHWSFEDPDDPTNENPRMHRDAGKILDPNDYAGRQKIGEKADDNDPSKKAMARPRFTQLEARFPLSSRQTPIDPLTRESKVRLDVSDIAGDNYRLKADVKPFANVTQTVPAISGVMTVWNRIDVEYVKMASARELPVEDIASHFDPACAQVDITLRREVSGADERSPMGDTEADADTWLEFYASKAAGQYTKEHEPGWFLLVAANLYVPTTVSSETIHYEGDAFASGNFIRFPSGKLYWGTPNVVRVYSPRVAPLLVPPYPKTTTLQASFGAGQPVSFNGSLWLGIQPKLYYDVNNWDKPSVTANLTDYGFKVDQSVKVQLASGGYGLPAGLCMTRSVGGEDLFSGRVFIFTGYLPEDRTLVTLIHELGHAFVNTHMCGNWDWVDDAQRSSCCLSYSEEFVLDDAKPRKPIPWTQGRRSAEFCPQHLRRLRDFHLEDNKGYAWNG